MPIKAFIFDMDDVLCHYDVGVRIARLAALSGQSVPDVKQAIWESDYFTRADRGDWTAQECLQEFGARLGYALTRDEWVFARRAAMTPLADMLAFAARVKNQMPMALLTNNDRLTAETLDALFPELRSLFGAHLYVSAELQLAKPDPEIFRHIVSRLGVAPQDALFIDDLQENIDGAQKAGLHALRFSGFDGFINALVDYPLPAGLLAE